MASEHLYVADVPGADIPRRATHHSMSALPPFSLTIVSAELGRIGHEFPRNRLPISFKKLGPCKRKDYEESKQRASTFGETWASADEVQFVEAGGKTGTGTGTKENTGGSSQVAGGDTSGWTPRMVAFWDKSIDVNWEDKNGKQFTATYYPDGTSAWTYKGDNAEYPAQPPPPMPSSFGGKEIKFKTTSTAPSEEKPGNTKGQKKTTEKSGTGGSGKAAGKDTGKSGEKGKGKAAEKKGKKGTTASGKSGGGTADLIGKGVSIGLGIAGQVNKMDKGSGMKSGGMKAGKHSAGKKGMSTEGKGMGMGF